MTNDSANRLLELDRQIVKATRSLKLTTAFMIELVDPSRSTVEYLDGMVIQLEERLIALESMRVKVLKAD